MIIRRKKEKEDKHNAPNESDEPHTHGHGTGPSPRDTERINLPNNSIFIMGLETNKSWVHSIRQDNRPKSLKSPPELAFEGQRISLTFRKINTYLSSDQTRIYGQGATGKAVDCFKLVINGDKEESDRMIFAFSRENREAGFDWEENYGRGFDVLHFSVVEHGIEAPVSE